MVKITYITNENVPHVIDVAAGSSVMEGARDNDIPGIEADCGGSCACATCHVYVDAEWINELPAPDNTEAEMLDFAFAPDPALSRLTCQIKVTQALEGLIVRMPEMQA